MTNKLLHTAAFLLFLGSPAFAQIAAEDAMDLLDQYPASRLDSLLPKTPFGAWFRSLVGASAKIDWEVNDCGEQTGVPAVDEARDMPVCLEVSAILPDQRKVGVAIGVGTQKKGLVGNPGVYSVYLESGGEIHHLKRLSDVPKALGQAQNK